MWNFSNRQRLHFFVLLEYECALPRIFHVILYSMFFSFSDQMYLLNSVVFLSLWFENDCLWLVYRSLNSVSVNPTYVSLWQLLVLLGPVLGVVTEAW